MRARGTQGPGEREPGLARKKLKWRLPGSQMTAELLQGSRSPFKINAYCVCLLNLKFNA